jgi:catechol 2,3-dioxygenase-like lactoylglutathione lyase family enzyme
MLTIARYGTRDLLRAGKFYDAIAQLLGAKRVHVTAEALCYQGDGGVMFVIGLPFAGEANAGNGAQLGFAAARPELVDAVYAKALELGGADEGPPGARGAGPNRIYAAYFRDLDGNKLMVYHSGAGG